ncbi:hypothetical protein OIU84_007697 [Salix udensis]|uniref:Uncharacterized protein n=1 Tax=Salix udensis TaxID=889485 RepID=A0AAD6JTM4_9ROSI|nr:hypothetical protein OIU84_007697 [Salix udensis]
MGHCQCTLKQLRRDFSEHHFLRLSTSLHSQQKQLRNLEKEWHRDMRLVFRNFS